MFLWRSANVNFQMKEKERPAEISIYRDVCKCLSWLMTYHKLFIINYNKRLNKTDVAARNVATSVRLCLVCTRTRSCVFIFFFFCQLPKCSIRMQYITRASQNSATSTPVKASVCSFPLYYNKSSCHRKQAAPVWKKLAEFLLFRRSVIASFHQMSQNSIINIQFAARNRDKDENIWLLVANFVLISYSSLLLSFLKSIRFPRVEFISFRMFLKDRYEDRWRKMVKILVQQSYRS